MQRSSSRPIKGPDSERVFIAGPFLSHYRHVQNGRRTSSSCGFCSQGMGSILKDVEITVLDGPGVAKDIGGDPEGPAPHSHGDGQSTDEYYNDMYREDERREA